MALDPTTVEVLGEHRRRLLDERLDWGPAYRDHGLVFCREDGTPIWPRTVSRSFDHRVRDVGLPKIRLHDLRHTHTTLALEAGVHPKVVRASATPRSRSPWTSTHTQSRRCRRMRRPRSRRCSTVRCGSHADCCVQLRNRKQGDMNSGNGSQLRAAAPCTARPVGDGDAWHAHTAAAVILGDLPGRRLLKREVEVDEFFLGGLRGGALRRPRTRQEDALRRRGRGPRPRLGAGPPEGPR